MITFDECFIIKYGEIALRGGNRAIYENMLLSAIRRALGENSGLRCYKEQGRFIAAGEAREPEAALKALRGVFGVAYVCEGIRLREQSLDCLKEAAVLIMERCGACGGTFRIETRRADKRYPISSNEVSAAVGEAVLERFPNLTAKMKKPDITVNIELRTDAFVYCKQYEGLGGLPPNSNGKGVLLLSGGFDSPVAGFLAARRGVGLVCAYFESPPYTSERAALKVRDLAAVLAGCAFGVKLYQVPFTETQLFLRDNAPDKKLTILLKRAMLRAASIIAERENAQMLITGDSLGQVASQTAHSLAAMESAANLPIIRPLATMDKREIIDLAKEIGTHDISVLPYEDCCTLFVPEHPETKPKASIIEAVERDLTGKGLFEMIKKAVDGAEVFDV